MDSSAIPLGPPISLEKSTQRESGTSSAPPEALKPRGMASPAAFASPIQQRDPFLGSPSNPLSVATNGHSRELSNPFTASPSSINYARADEVNRPDYDDTRVNGNVSSFTAGPPASYKYPPQGPSTHTQSPSSSVTSQPHVQPLHPRSLSAYLSTHPNDTVRKAISKTYPKPNPVIRLARRFRVRYNVIHGLTDKELAERESRQGKEKRALAGWRLAHEPEVDEDGKTRTLVTDLFWKIYLSILPTLERDPLSGLVAPPLLGSTTTMPLSVISLIPDIMRHYRDIIVRAEKEVFLVTNYWQPSNSVTTICDALRELSAKTVKKHKPGEPIKKVVVKLVYDRGTLEQIWNAHASVPTTGWGVMKIPLPEEVPGLDLEVVNFHRLLMGTFHAKFLIVDRKVALINSNNIQDRPNLEMMQHFEGPVVDSFYETALHSWYNKLSPMMPCIGHGYQYPMDGYKFGQENPYFDDIETVKAAKEAIARLRQETAAMLDEDATNVDPLDRFRGIVRKAMERATTTANERWDGIISMAAANNQAGTSNQQSWADKVRSGFGTRPNSRRPSYDDTQRRLSAPIIHQRQDRHDMATLSSETSGMSPTLVNEPTNGGDPSVLGKPVPLDSSGHTEQDYPKKVKILQAEGVDMSKHDADHKIAHAKSSSAFSESEPAPLSASSTFKLDSMGRPRSGSGRLQMLTEKFNATGVLSEASATVEDNDDLDDFSPHMLHEAHKPFPIAMVNRRPHGMPGHHDIRNPQNAAWLAGCRYAKHKIFIQTPTLNARPIKRAIKQACRRGVEVVLYLDLGFNDKGESIPFQGGTNEQVVEWLYSILRKDRKEQFLKVYWYTGKDQIRPLNAVKKQRNCHIKFAMFDDQVAIFGNGNQDTQSWMHSQETNVMIDQKEVIAEMMHTLHTNQNTHRYGLVDPKDGVWRDKDGKGLADWDPNFKKAHNSMGLSGMIEMVRKM